MAIKNLVFDIGGVLADYRLKEFLAEKGFNAATIKRIVRASVMSPYWERFERGEITEEQALQGFVSRDPEIADALAKAYSSVRGMLLSRDYAIPLVRAVKAAGCGAYYLSNYSKKAYDECAESLAFMEYMDGGVVSFRVGLTKPDPAIYRRFLRDFGLKESECLFIDDTLENVDVARSLGFEGVVFTSCQDLIAYLSDLGVDLALDAPTV